MGIAHNNGAKNFLDHSRGVWGNAPPENFENNVFKTG